MSFRVIPVQGFPGLALVEPTVRRDARGWFFEATKASAFEAAGLPGTFVQENQSGSARGVVRGLHYQLPPKEQGKLVRCVRGSVFDAVVDLRRASPSFGRAFATRLEAADPRLLWVPPGFAHGFQALEEGAELLYQCTQEYAPDRERCIRWDDPALAIAWPLPARLLAPKDAAAPLLADAELPQP